MKTTDIIIIIIAIVILFMLYNDTYNEPSEKNHFEVEIPKPIYSRINTKKQQIIEKMESDTDLIENLDNIEHYPLTFTISDTVAYIPDDCLPLNIKYNKTTRNILLNGSGQIVATDQSLNPIVATSPIILNLILSKQGFLDSQIEIPNIQFSVSKCNNDTSVTITNNITTPTTLNNMYDSISGSIKIGLLSFNIDKITFATTKTIRTIFYENTRNQGKPFIPRDICGIKTCNPNPSGSNLAPVIQAPLNAIDTLVENNKIFALYTYIKKKGIPTHTFNDTTNYKVYLTSQISPDKKYGLCNSLGGMFKFTTNLTQGSLFNASKTIRKFPLLHAPYKYLDFYNVLFSNNMEFPNEIQSMFYNLSLNYNDYSLSYCLRDCDTNNPTGFCSQETPKTENRQSSAYMETMGTEDKYELKNFMKFKFESDGAVTPYFISFSDNAEKIYFITNKYNTSDDQDAYKVPVHVPTYGDKAPYFELPDITVQNSINFYTTKQVPITGLNNPYTETEAKDYFEKAYLPPEETKAFVNDAYKNYALKFYVEEIDPKVTDIKKLPLNE